MKGKPGNSIASCQDLATGASPKQKLRTRQDIDQSPVKVHERLLDAGELLQVAATVTLALLSILILLDPGDVRRKPLSVSLCFSWLASVMLLLRDIRTRGIKPLRQVLPSVLLLFAFLPLLLVLLPQVPQPVTV